MNSAPLLLSGGFSEAVWLLQTAEASVLHTYTHAERARHPPTSQSKHLSPTQCGFKRTGALKSAAGSSFSPWCQSEGEREGERWAVLRNWVHTILLRHLQLSREIRWTAYPGSCKWCCTEAHFDPTPLGGRCARSIPPLRVFLGGSGACTTSNQSKQVVMKIN